MNKEELELKVLKHLVTSEKAINKALSLNINEGHINFTPDPTKKGYHQILFVLLMKYYEESGGSLLTKGILESRLVKSNCTDKQKGAYMLLWERIQEQDYDENELYDLLIQLKHENALMLWTGMLKSGYDTFKEDGLEPAVDIIQEKLEEIKNEIRVIEYHAENIDMAHDDAIDYFQKEYKKRQDFPELYKGIECGLVNIDRKTQGFLPAQIITLLAFSSGGKSIQLMNWAIYAHMFQKKKVLYVSFEMDLWLCLLRHISRVFEIPFYNLKGTACNDDDINMLIDKWRAMNGDTYFEYEVSMEDPTPEFIDAKIRKLIDTKGKPDIVIIDYIGNMTTRDTPKEADQWKKNGNAIELLHVLAKRYQIPFLTAQQINRETIRETRKLQEAHKRPQFWQDASSGDQRLMHLSYYVLAMDSDKENNMITYYPVKMRDATFEPFCAKVNSDTNAIYEITEQEQEEYRALRGYSDSVKSSNTPRIIEEDGATRINEHNTTPEDLIINDFNLEFEG